MTTWYTSDWHIGHARIIELSARPFPDLDRMHEALISRHNALVRPEDHVWVLGDVALGPILVSLELVREFTGHLHLVLGNHDRPFDAMRSGKPDKALAWTEAYLEAGFETVTAGPVTTHIPELGDVLLSHFPYRGDSQDVDRFTEQRPADTGLPLLHGHVHEKWKRYGPMLNVGVDVWDFRPVRQAEVVAALLDGDPASSW